MNKSTSLLCKYRYQGPVFIYGRECYEADETTSASTEKQALNNIRYKIHKKIGFDLAIIRLDPSYLMLVEDYSYRDYKPTARRCTECGNLLTDSGECRFCDSDIF